MASQLRYHSPTMENSQYLLAQRDEFQKEQQKSYLEGKKPGIFNKSILLNKIINSQARKGYWKECSILKEAIIIDFKIACLENALKLKVLSQDLSFLVSTVLFLWVLRELFEEKRDEWQMIARKAKNYLKSHGVTDLEPLYKMLCKL